MQTKALLFFIAGLQVLPAFSQVLAPSPTESIGCEPHGDHWHCDGPRPTTIQVPTRAVTTTSAAAAITTTVEEDHDDHTDAPVTATPGPSPTESIGCEPHGDHWDCEGPKETAAPVKSAASTSVEQSTLVTATATRAFSSTRTAGAVVTAGAAKGPAALGVPLLGFVVAAAVGL
ncbi:hypothetical protein QBC44DRAFT_301052 [Cladorrhinum sp. PSN332]|nr:hypothetical protein QBC44DRAFT_301052 [Cladorrhinum sp. PSN332]